jgi:carboxyl-terminal processing protease
VLVNGGSASASEIMAAAIKENARGLIVGEPSFGKGSVQNVIPLNEDATEALKLTTAQYYTPQDHIIDRDNPVTPDVEIQMSPELQLALRYQAREDKMRQPGNGKPPEETKPKDEVKAPPEAAKGEAEKAEVALKRRARARDIQLEGALAILKAQLQAAAMAAAKPGA